MLIPFLQSSFIFCLFFLCSLSMCLLLIAFFLFASCFRICVFGLFHSTYIYNSYKLAYFKSAVTLSQLDIDA